MPRALVAIGSNLGDREAQLRQAVELLTSTDDVRLLRVSAMRETLPVGGSADQPAYLNGAVLVETSLSPRDLLSRLMEVERSLGRQRTEHWGPRTVDLDLLLYDDVVLQSPTLTLPHPRMAFRRFVLEPAAEIAGELRHPMIGLTVAELLEHLNTARPYVAISGATYNYIATQRLAARVAERTGWTLLNSLGPGGDIALSGLPRFTTRGPVELLRDKANLLSEVDWKAFECDSVNGHRWNKGIISSFWFDDYLPILGMAWQGRFDTEANAIVQQVVRPKLLVVWDGPLQKAVPKWSHLPTYSRKINQAMRERANRQGIGPLLWLNDADAATAQRELVAAIEGMD